MHIKTKKSFLCIGLDPDMDKIPEHLKENEDPIFEFCKAIVDSTQHLAVAYKPNTAFFEAHGLSGWQALKKVVVYIRTYYPGLVIIADAKRGDIGNTSRMYAQCFFEELQCDAVTVAPYMGKDSVEPFLEYEDKFTVLLALTSNKGASDFQFTEDTRQIPVFQHVLETSKSWKNAEQLMYVIGATKAEYLKTVREIVPDSFLLIPGVGAQGGSLEDVCKHGLNKENVGLLVNSSRGILYASNGEDFATQAAKKAAELQQQMERLLSEYEVDLSL